MPKQNKSPAGWNPIAAWYNGWVGKDGSEHHQKLAIPAVMNLLELQKGEQVLDIGAGQGVLAPHLLQAGAIYTGIDISPKLITLAKQQHKGRFMVGDARQLNRLFEPEMFDATVFLLSIQDMNPLEAVIQSASGVLRKAGRVVILMTHPCFRVPRQSGWGYDEKRKLQYRRVDRYLTPLPVPMKPYPGNGTTISFHRPLSEYINTLAEHGLLVDSLQEITTYKASPNKAERLAEQEIPVFLALRARKL